MSKEKVIRLLLPTLFKTPPRSGLVGVWLSASANETTFNAAAARLGDHYVLPASPSYTVAIFKDSQVTDMGGNAYSIKPLELKGC